MEISNADVGISTTGVAGPDGGSKEKPVGLGYVGLATKNNVHAYKLLLSKGEKGKEMLYENQQPCLQLTKL